MTGSRRHSNKPNGSYKSYRSNRGFTLVELLVAMSIFSIVVVIVSSIYISTVSSQRKAFGQQDILENSRFTIESMARAIRQSTVVSASATTLDINHPTKGALTYSMVNGRVEESNIPLTSDDVVVESLTFFTSGISALDTLQPRITIVLVMRSTPPKVEERSTITIQTTITPRKLQL